MDRWTEDEGMNVMKEKTVTHISTPWLVSQIIYNVAITTFSYRRWTGKPQSVLGDVCKSKTSSVTLSSFQLNISRTSDTYEQQIN